jgi:hypothetical protein
MKRIGQSNFYRSKYGIGYQVNSRRKARNLNIMLGAIYLAIVAGIAVGIYLMIQ